MLAHATLRGGPAERAALEGLCRRYWPPVRECIRSRGVQPDRVEDLTQDFFVHLMEAGLFRRAEQEQGRFRSFLMGSLRFFLANDAARNATQRRGGGVEHCELEDDSAVIQAEEAIFDREWAQTLLAEALASVEKESRARRGDAVWEVLRRYLPGSHVPESYDALTAVMGITATGAKAEVSRLRARYREALRREVGRTVSTPEDVDAELSHLRAVLSASMA